MEQKEKKRKKKKNFRGGYYDYNLLAIVILLRTDYALQYQCL